MYIYIYIYVCLYIKIYTYMYKYLCTYMNVCMYTHIQQEDIGECMRIGANVRERTEDMLHGGYSKTICAP